MGEKRLLGFFLLILTTLGSTKLVIDKKKIEQWKSEAKFLDVKISSNLQDETWPRMEGSKVICPSEVKITFKHGKKDIELQLELNSDLLNTDQKVYLDGFPFGSNKFLPTLQCLYNDFTDEGEFEFDRDDGKLKIDGDFTTTDGTWSLETVDGTEKNNVHNKKFKVYKVSKGAMSDREHSQRKKQFLNNIQTRARKPKYYMQVWPVFDHKATKVKRFHNSDKKVVMRNIKKYLNKIFNALRTRFAGISDKFELIPFWARNYVYLNKEMSFYKKKNMYDLYNRVSEFEKFYQKYKRYFTSRNGRAAHVMLFTGHPAPYGGIVSKIGSVCSDKAVSIVWPFPADGIYEPYHYYITSHELGHSLGAKHDHLHRKKSCNYHSGGGKFLMIARFQDRREMTRLFHGFSQCSKRDMEKYIGTLNPGHCFVTL